MTITPVTRLVAALTAGVLTLSGCANQSAPTAPTTAGASPGSGTPATGEFNAADIMFAQMMIPHHAQAVQMSDIVLAKDGVREPVRSLAEAIRGAQAPEIALMSGWLAGWGFSGSPEPMEGMGSGGMLSQAELDAIKAAQGEEAETLFLKGMVAHHEGAVSMAKDELREGVNPQAKQLAEAIITSQEAEITQMKELLR